MKKTITFLILFILSCNLALAEVIYYEDFTFYGKLVTDINLDETIREQPIQVTFPSFISQKIPVILNGKAKFEEIDNKPMLRLELNELSIDAKKRIPVEILVTGVNGKKLENGSYPNQNKYKTGLNKANAYAKEFALFPINRFNAIPKVAKPSGNNFVMLLEPVYAFGGLILFALSPLTAPFYADDNFCDIHKGSMIEFQFLKEVTKQKLNKTINTNYI